MHRVLVVDDSDIFRRSLRAIVRKCTEWEICGEAQDAESGTRFAQELKPDVIVMDISMPGVSGIEAIRRVRSLVSNAQIVILSLHESKQLVENILEVGACGYVVKPESGFRPHRCLEFRPPK